MNASPILHISGSVPHGTNMEALHGVDDNDFTRQMFVSDPSVFQTVKKSDLVVAIGFRTGTDNTALLNNTVIGITGDGSFLMSCSDFVTAVEAQTPIVLIILNDCYGMITMMQRRQYGRDIHAHIQSPDFAAFARSFGAHGIRVEDPADLADAYAEALRRHRPTIIDVVSGPTYACLDYQAMLQNTK